MGISGLLPFLKGIQRNVNVSSFEGKKVAVDAYCWLHKGSYSCATQLVMKSAKLETLPFIKYCVRRVNLLIQRSITPIMVFDGGYLPTKANTEKDRREKRKAYLTKGKELLKMGKKSEANDCFQKSVDVSPDMALALIKECRKLGVECIVAPYEADAQLAYLSKENIVDLVITEDSDLLVFGCKRVLFKMDESGNGNLIDTQDLGKANKSLVGFTEDSFRQMCIFSGCDYLASVPGIGLGKATKLMRKHNKNPTQVIRALHYENNKVPPDYEANFKKAEYTFLYQLVFDPRTQKQVRLNELPDDVDVKEFEFAGVENSPRKAVHMARGNINPITHEYMDSYSPSKCQAPPPTKSTSWSGSAMGSAHRKYPVAIQANISLISTSGASNQFKPPKKAIKTSSTDENDAGLGDMELQSMYSSASMPTDSSIPMVPSEPEQVSLQSRFFASSSTSLSIDDDTGYSEQTPSDNDGILQSKKSVRKLYTEEDCTSNHDRPLEEQKNHPSYLSALTTCSALSQVETPNADNSAKKQLFVSSGSKMNQFAFLRAKKRRRDDEDVDLDTIKQAPSDVSKSKNPFSMSRVSLSNVTGSPFNSEPQMLAEAQSEDTDMKDTDMIEDVPSTSCDDALIKPNLSSTNSLNMDCSLPTSTSLSDIPECHILESGAQKIEKHSVSTKSPHFCSKITQPSKGKSIKIRKSKQMGLSKNYKSAKSSDPGFKQTTLTSNFNYSSKSQMKLD